MRNWCWFNYGMSQMRFIHKFTSILFNDHSILCNTSRHFKIIWNQIISFSVELLKLFILMCWCLSLFYYTVRHKVVFPLKETKSCLKRIKRRRYGYSFRTANYILPNKLVSIYCTEQRFPWKLYFNATHFNAD